MSTDLSEFKRMNATGVGEQDLRDADGGNNSRGCLGNVRPTGITARGDKKRSTASRELGGRK